MKKFSLDLESIKKFQQNRYPYLMIDYVDEVVPGVSANGYKDLKDDWFFKVHWPKDPNMPGMLQIETLVQMAALTVLTLPGNEGKTVYLVSANNLLDAIGVLSSWVTERVKFLCLLVSLNSFLYDLMTYTTPIKSIKTKTRASPVIMSILLD